MWPLETPLVILLPLAIALSPSAPTAAPSPSGGGGPALARPTCATSAHGAHPSASRYSTAALQAAIDACSASCGTVVVDVPGAYLTASLLLSGCVHLHLPAGVTLLAGTRRRDYGPTQPDWYLLRFANCTGCRLSGGGTVDGRARLWVEPAGGERHPRHEEEQQQQQVHQVVGELGIGAAGSTRQLAAAARQGQQRSAARQQRRRQAQQQARGSERARGGLPPPEMPRKAVRNWRDPSCPRPDECRPRLVGVVDSADVSITGVTLTDPVYWCLHVLRSGGVRISGVRIRGDWDIPNNDGIDVDGSRHVSISHADVDTADDTVCLKTTAAGFPLEHVSVTDCRLRSRSSAIKLGSESRADMRHLRFARLAIADSHRGLAIQLRDGGSISDVRFEGITIATRYYHPSWWGAAEPIYVTALPRAPGMQVGSVADVTFSNISATAENGIFLSGGPLVAGSAGGSEAGSSGRPATASQPGGAGAGAVGRTAGGAEMRRQQRQQQQQQQRSLRGIRMERVSVRLRQRSRFAGGCQDYRPSSNASLGAGAAAGGAHRRGGLSPGWWWPAGLDCSSGSTAAVWVAGADDVRLSDVEVEYGCPARDDWRRQLHIDAASTSGVTLRNVSLIGGSCGT